MRVLMITSEWPSEESPYSAPFVVRQFNKLIENNINVDIVHVRGAGNLFRYIKNWKKVHKILKNGNYNIIHAQWGQSALSAIPSSLPLVVTYRGDDLEGIINNKGKHGLNSYVLQFIGRVVSSISDYNIVVSSHMIPKLWGNKAPVKVIPSGIDFTKIPTLTKSEARKKWNFPLNKKVVIFPNDKSKTRKRFDLVEKCIELLPPEYKEMVELRVVYGFKHHEILEQMIASDFLIFTSIHEGSPNVVKEAIACNLPIISVNVADVSERIGKIEGCHVVEGYNAIDLSNALKLALDHDYSNYSSIEFSKSLDENILVKNLIETYQSLIK
ncbi:MAG: hypothetical protein CFE21_00170 [Bacteroidetes bacterium B1(2017)]|nr:MAG: hypothetical protein CFE21_00170 [Bacteroidetes bacterium B1(2017)]